MEKDFGVDYIFANELVIKDGKVQGYNARTEAGKNKKADIIKEVCKKLDIDLKEVIYIGDTDVDLAAFKIVGKAIAFNAESKELKKHAHIVVDSNDLRDVLPHLNT